MITITNPSLLTAIGNLSKVLNIPDDQIAEILLTGSLARSAAWAAKYGVPQPGAFEFIKDPQGNRFTINETYRSVYEQTIAWINTLAIAERLLLTVIRAAEDGGLFDKNINMDSELLQSFELYRDRAKNREYVQ